MRQQQLLLALAAPAGYGKSTLMTQWWQHLEQLGQRCLWLGLDALDVTAARFEEALLGALGLSEQQDLKSALLAFEALDKPAVLFVDDLHFLNAQEAEHVLAWLLNNSPRGLQLVLAGRGMPESIGLSRLVLEGRASRYGAMDLALTSGELAEMLAVPAADELPSWLLALHKRTEGWPLAARIVAFSREEGSELKPPSGRDPDLSSYLTDVLLQGLPEAFKETVFAAALLPRFCAAQLNAMLGGDYAEQHLQWLEQNNLFLIPLDRERRWYRFHHLISEFLSSRVALENSAARADWLQRAAQWSEAEGLVEDAIDLALAAGNDAFAAEQLERESMRLAQYEGRHERILAWVARLPPQELLPRYTLRLNHVVAMTFTGQLGLARETAAGLIKDVLGQVDAKQEAEFRSGAEIFASLIAVLEDEPTLADELSRDWLAHWEDASPLFTGAACAVRGYSAKCRSDFDGALMWTQKAKECFLKSGSTYAEAWAATLQAVTLLRMGALQQAQDVVSSSLNATVRRLGAGSSSGNALNAMLASIYLERGDIEAASSALDFSFDALGVHASADGLIAAWLTAARIKAMQGHRKAAQALLLEGEAVGQERGLPRLVLSLVTERAINHIRVGHLELARSILATEFASYESREDLADLIADKRSLLDARFMLAAGDELAALALVQQQLQHAKDKQQQLKVLQWLIVAAAAGTEDQRCQSLAEALEVAETCGALRMLEADADLIRTQLATAISQANISPAFADRVLQRVGVELLPAANALTKKELQILMAAHEGLSNKELAAQLYVSEGTVKWHLHNIYNKLDAKNRSSAIAKARAAGLI